MEGTNKINQSKLIRNIVGITFGVITSILVQKYLFNTNDNIDQKLRNVSEATNKNCPMYVDGFTRLDNTVALPNNKFQYNYTISIDTTIYSLSTLKTNLHQSILNSVKTNPSLKDFRDNNVTMVYSYSDSVGHFLFKTEFAPNDYK